MNRFLRSLLGKKDSERNEATPPSTRQKDGPTGDSSTEASTPKSTAPAEPNAESHTDKGARKQQQAPRSSGQNSKSTPQDKGKQDSKKAAQTKPTDINRGLARQSRQIGTPTPQQKQATRTQNAKGDKSAPTKGDKLWKQN